MSSRNSRTIFSVYQPHAKWRRPIWMRPVSLITVLMQIKANRTTRILIGKLYRNGAIDENDLASLIGEDVQVNAWHPVDFCKEHPNEADDMPEGTYVKG